MTKRALSMLLCCLLPLDQALATEGALGRPITGLQGTSYAGLIPPTPGFSTQFGYIHYSGDLGTQRQIPVAGLASLGLHADVDIFAVTGVYIWDTGAGSWNFASMLTVPFIDVHAQADVVVGPVRRTVNDSASGVFDVFFAPVIASRHFSATKHMSLALYVYAPTGDYQAGRLANPGLNVWTYSPTVGYTQLLQGGTLEWSSTSAVDFYTRNNDTNYKNGAVFRIDSLLVKRLPSGWGIGAAGGWIQQVQNDQAVLADRLDGFRGHSLAVGPIATYASKWDGGQVEFSARWLHEFDVKNRLKGDPFLLSASIQF